MTKLLWGRKTTELHPHCLVSIFTHTLLPLQNGDAGNKTEAINHKEDKKSYPSKRALGSIIGCRLYALEG